MDNRKKKTWLSHSGVDVLYRCPRCFWLKYNKKIVQPEGIVSRLANRFDKVIKEYFDNFRDKGILPPIIEGKLPGKLENPFQEKYFWDLNEKYGFWGKLDECLVLPDGSFSPVDFKTASSDPREREVFQAYQNQMDEFSFLLEMNGKKTSGTAYLIYFFPAESRELHNGFPMVIHIQPLKTYPDSVKPRLQEAIKILEGPMPPPKGDCPFCSWYEDLARTIDEK
jgi:hypothetical protein